MKIKSRPQNRKETGRKKGRRSTADRKERGEEGREEVSRK
jgi:hypothetical protein